MCDAHFEQAWARVQRQFYYNRDEWFAKAMAAPAPTAPPPAAAPDALPVFGAMDARGPHPAPSPSKAAPAKAHRSEGASSMDVCSQGK